MKKSVDYDDPKKKTMAAAAEHFSSASPMQPPSFAQTSTPSHHQSAISSQATTESTEHRVSDQNSGGNSQQGEKPKGVTTVRPSKLFQAVKVGHKLVKQTSRLVGVRIQGAFAFGALGCLQASRAKSLIYSSLASDLDTMENRKMAKAVSNVISRFLEDWLSGFSIPNVMWYPAFHSFPAIAAPLIPNLPARLAEMPSLNELFLTHKENMIREIMRELPTLMDNDINRETATSFSKRTVGYFDQWIENSYLTNIFGMGKAPTFALPFSLGGPVKDQVIFSLGVLS